MVKCFTKTGKILSITFFHINKMKEEADDKAVVHLTCEELDDLFYENPIKRTNTFYNFIQIFYQNNDRPVTDDELREFLSKTKR